MFALTPVAGSVTILMLLVADPGVVRAEEKLHWIVGFDESVDEILTSFGSLHSLHGLQAEKLKKMAKNKMEKITWIFISAFVG